MGTGIPLHMDNCLDKSHWASQGILGEILQELRTKLKNSPTVQPTEGIPVNSATNDAIDVSEDHTLAQVAPDQQSWKLVKVIHV